MCMCVVDVVVGGGDVSEGWEGGGGGPGRM